MGFFQSVYSRYLFVCLLWMRSAREIVYTQHIIATKNIIIYVC